MARRVHRAKSFSYDLLADWRPYASPPVADHRGWIYHGTVTLEGVTGALAWRRGLYGIAVGDRPVRDLGMWERIRICQEVRSRDVLGWETVRRFPSRIQTWRYQRESCIALSRDCRVIAFSLDRYGTESDSAYSRVRNGSHNIIRRTVKLNGPSTWRR